MDDDSSQPCPLVASAVPELAWSVHLDPGAPPGAGSYGATRQEEVGHDVCALQRGRAARPVLRRVRTAAAVRSPRPWTGPGPSAPSPGGRRHPARPAAPYPPGPGGVRLPGLAG